MWPHLGEPARTWAAELTSASQPETHLPPSRTTAFCRNCLTNQTLVVNMLANYLPDENVSITFREKLANVRTRATPTSWRGYQHIVRRCTRATHQCVQRVSLQSMRH